MRRTVASACSPRFGVPTRHLAAIADDQQREIANTQLPTVNQQLTEIVGVQLGIQGGHVVLRYDVAGVAPLCALGLMFLLDDDRGLGHRLGGAGRRGASDSTWHWPVACGGTASATSTPPATSTSPSGCACRDASRRRGGAQPGGGARGPAAPEPHPGSSPGPFPDSGSDVYDYPTTFVVIKQQEDRAVP
jgi:hypothetical protein